MIKNWGLTHQGVFLAHVVERVFYRTQYVVEISLHETTPLLWTLNEQFFKLGLASVKHV